jgi:hypothetical protein
LPGWNAIICHLHIDHCHDLLPLGKTLLSAIAHYPSAPGEADQSPAKLPLYVPSGASLLLTWTSLLTVDSIPLLDRVFDGAFEVREYKPGGTFTIGDATVELFELRHAKTNCGIRVTSRAGSLAYTGGTRVTDEITRLARGVDLLLAETSLDQTGTGSHGHLCAIDAARATQGGCGRSGRRSWWPRTRGRGRGPGCGSAQVRGPRGGGPELRAAGRRVGGQRGECRRAEPGQAQRDDRRRYDGPPPFP